MEEVRIAMCMGSACFARGNNLLLDALEEAIEKNGWRDRVFLSGARCENRCGDGPSVTVNGERYDRIDCDGLLQVIAEKLGL